MFYHVALLSPPYATLTYCAPVWLDASLWRPGLRVAVPLGSGAVRAGVILDAAESPDLPDGVSARPLVWPLERHPLLGEHYIDMTAHLARRQLVTPGNILGAVLPQGLRTTGRIRVREFTTGGRPRLLHLRELPRLGEERLRELGAAFLDGRVEVLALREDAASGEMCRLECEPPWKVRPNALRQREVLEYLWERGSVSRRRLRDALPESSAALESLVRAGLVRICPQDAEDAESDEERGQEALLPPPPPPYELTGEQQAAVDACCAEMDAARAVAGDGKASLHLVYGVTGSGKTAVYLELARACLERGRTALLLAPEVALALKLRRDAEARFPGLPVFLFHGYQSPARRERTFRELAARREPCVVVGTRSALFLPLPELGLMVLDEEHDASFKQDEGLHYQAKEVAWCRAALSGALLVLGSATPDVKTFYAARRGVLSLTRLPHRVGGGALPSIELVDISRDAVGAGQGLLAQASLEALRQTVRRGEQAVVLLNRRGYAPLMYCLDCKTVARCPHCDIGLTYHKRREQLVCHYCGFTLPFPSPCARCGGLNYLPMGEGTERLEERLAGEELAAVLPPGGRVLRLDRDSTRRPGRMEEILAAFARGEAQVLVGTQMLSKGHHFPDVTLALIADADLGLNLPDYRAMERTFQLLLQSAGRAGRGEKAGRVLIQTRMPNHVCWDFVRRGDYDAFYEHEIALREKRRYPPFVKLALVRASFPAEDAEGGSEGQAALNRFMGLLREEGRTLGLTLMGPIPSPLARLQGRMRFQALIKADDWQKVRQAYGRAMRRAFGGGAAPKTLRLSLDLDPVNML